MLNNISVPCDAGFESIHFLNWPGTNTGCYFNGIVHEKSCYENGLLLNGSLIYPLLPLKMYGWNGKRLCFSKVSSIKYGITTEDVSDPEKEICPNNLVVPKDEKCPINLLRVVSK